MKKQISSPYGDDPKTIQRYRNIFNSECAYSVQQTTDGGYIVVGDTFSYSGTREELWILKLDSNGIEQWRKNYGGINDECAYSVQQTTDGGYIVVGETNSFSTNGYPDMWILKINDFGEIK